MKECKEIKPLPKKHQRVLDEYLLCFNQTRAYQAVYKNSTYESARTAAARLFANDNFLGHLQAKLDEIHMSSDEALKRQSDIARGDVGVFFKVVDEWMFNPLPEYEILDEREVLDTTGEIPKKKVTYRVRHVVLDMDKIVNPEYSWMLKSFSNSRKNGVKIETHDQYAALRDILKVHDKLHDPGEKIELIVRYATNDKPPESSS